MQVIVKSQFIVFWGKETVHTFFKAYEIFGTEILTRSDLDSQSNWFNREKNQIFFQSQFYRVIILFTLFES